MDKSPPVCQKVTKRRKCHPARGEERRLTRGQKWAKLRGNERGEGDLANATKRILAMALKERLARQRLDEITIQSLVDDAQVSRKTFYYHFQDVYALLEWLFLEEGKRVLEGNVSASTWQIGMRRIFAYAQENKAVILNVYRCLEDREGLLEIHITRLVRPLLERIFDEMPHSEQLDGEDRKIILDFYAFGLVELFLRWIGNGMKPEGGQLMDRLDRIFSGSMESLIQRCLNT